MKTKTLKILLEDYGSYLGMKKGCFIVKNKQGQIKKYPLFENVIDEIRIKSGNIISSGTLASCGFWGINCLFVTQARAIILPYFVDGLAGLVVSINGRYGVEIGYGATSGYVSLFS
jgi:CRISPR/Cas system-associated endonuclease Cas1